MSLDTLFSGVFDGAATGSISVLSFCLCVAVALLIGLLIAVAYTYKTKHTKSFVVTLAILPAVVCMVIMMVNGNIGAGVAVAGTFSLVRFRSVPGTAKEIGAIFLAMGTGLAAGIGYLAYAALFAIIVSGVTLIYNKSGIGGSPKAQRTLRITIPEDLDYTGAFDDLFQSYTSEHSLLSVKTANMGSLFKLDYDLVLMDSAREKEFLDDLRCRNGNLEITMARHTSLAGEL